MSAKNVINMSLTFKGKYEAVQSYLKKGTTYTKIPSFKNAEWFLIRYEGYSCYSHLTSSYTYQNLI